MAGGAHPDRWHVRFWTLADDKHRAGLGKDAVLQTASVTCNPNAGPTAYVITSLHVMVPPPGFKPEIRTKPTNSGTVTTAC